MFSEAFVHGLVGTVVFALVGIVFLVGGFKLFDRMLPKVDFQEKMQENPVACSIVVGSFLLALSHIIASVVH